MEDILKKLGSRIREERKRTGLTQEKFAEKVDLSVDYIGYIERGKQAPYIKTLERIAKILGVEVYELFIFRDKEKVQDKEEAIKTLVSSLRRRNFDEIKFVTSLQKQIFEKKSFS